MFHRSILSAVLIFTAFANPTVSWSSDIRFKVSLNDEQKSTGRCVVFVISDKATKLQNRDPVDGPFWDDPQPLFGINASLSKSDSVLIDDRADCFPFPPSQLPAGRYRAQARFDIHRQNSDWKREPNNRWSEVVAFEVSDASSPQFVEMDLKNIVAIEQPKSTKGVEWFEIKSSLLTQFRGTPTMLQAGIVLPTDYAADRSYAAIYEVPGFGDDHTSASNRRRASAGAASDLATQAFRIVLNPEGPNGHSLFADSDNNGPCGEALVRELIPAIEARYPLIRKASARLLRGHSSGGWSSLWLATQYPEVFGAAWSSAPDPVDFRRFQKVNIYSQPNFYIDEQGSDLPSLRSQDAVKMTIRQEARGEDVLGPDNTSAQQWDSWFAVFGTRNRSGNAAALFDPVQGTIDRAIATSFQRYDLCDLLRKDPTRYLPIFRSNIRLICGTEDSFYLNEAVSLLDEELKRLGRQDGDMGYIKLVPGDHGTVMATDAIRNIPSEMLQQLRSSGHIR